ncbi:DHH family phosphoesterase [Peptoniphilus catoniae]|uniref:DHH family phosphoesterase n=1 Tax=Peptoniphilus catoniae TaxID=1660341 RepID=UPI0010FEBBE4|nr:DHH family phosphoesterase [Peptoniphilus catoniae]
MKEKYTLKSFRPYLIISLILILILMYLKLFVGIGALFAYIYIAYYTVKSIDKKNKEVRDYFEDLSDTFDTVTKQAIFSMPFPILLLNKDKGIIWYNPNFIDMVGEDVSTDMHLSDIFEDLNVDEFYENKVDILEYSYKEKTYKIFKKLVSANKSSEDVLMLYFIDSTDFKNLEENYIDEKTIIAKIEVDNYDEAMDSTPTANRPLLIADIDSTISNYFKYFDALVRKYDTDTYLVVMSNRSLNMIKEKKFDILDDLRELDKGNTIPITLSIGVSSCGPGLIESYQEADTCLDLALGRGGDQVAVRIEDNYEFFGGKSKAIEKRNKVKARVLGVALKQLIDASDNVFIMGHKNADMDAIGSAIGILRAVLNRSKEGYIVLNSSNPSIDNLLNRMKNEEETYARIVKEEFAKNTMKQSSLLILVDNHKPSFTEAPDIIDLTPQIVIIDHHRRGKEFVKNPVLTYIEPYASSTCELVTEMLTYMNEDLNLTHFEADALMSGIVVDTKNFSYQTGVRTFEAASTLRRAGADMGLVKELFQDDLDTLQNKAIVIHNANIIHDEFAISKFEKQTDNAILIAAQSADELLGINNINASFVMALTNDGIHISGRSRGNISVQLILEKLGGGGHLNMAGARLDIKDFNEAEEMLVKAIDEYVEEEKVNK